MTLVVITSLHSPPSPHTHTHTSAGELVLMDAGCEYYGYVSDVTRTWPVSGEFTPAQRDLYEAVLRVKQRSILVCVFTNLLGINCLIPRPPRVPVFDP